MRWFLRTLLSAIAVGLLLRALLHASPFSLAEGAFDANANEAAECYFNVVQGVRPIATIVFPPKSSACDVAKYELIGKRGRLVFVVEEP